MQPEQTQMGFQEPPKATQSIREAAKTADTDWDAVKALYISGISTQILAKAFSLNEGSLRSRISRGEWNDLRDAAEKAVIEANGGDKHVIEGSAAGISEVQLRHNVSRETTLSQVQKATTIALSEQKAKFMNASAAFTAEAVEVVMEERRTDPSVQKLEHLASIHESLVRGAKPIHNLGSESSTGTGFNINILSDMTRLEMIKDVLPPTPPVRHELSE